MLKKLGYFLLAENIMDVFTKPSPWKIGHQCKMPDLPMNLPGDNRFFLANSLTGLVFGPFVQLHPQYFSTQGMSFARKYPGVPRTYDVILHWIMPFAQADQSYCMTHGLPWKYVAEILDLDESTWRNFRSLETTEDKFDRLCAELKRINIDETARFMAGEFILNVNGATDDDDDQEDWSYVGFLEQFYGNDSVLIEAHAESDDRD